ncbi:MAG: nucleotidyltransferase domain-containing protein [Candidatus Aerophobetes bacterium]|nr:nucleotidyltransferase domain-containing protein [Candidatus Aerophobetes bacterium]
MNKKALNILKQFKERLPISVKRHIIEIRCFGSYVREEEKKDSDLDVLVILDRENSQLEEKVFNAAYQLMWEYDFQPLLSVRTISKKHYNFLRDVNSLFYQNLQKEGIVV